MLKLLGEAETVIRRSPNVRLHVETLLIQWTLLDRTIELDEVVRALAAGTMPGSPVPNDPAAATPAVRVRPPAPSASASSRAPATPPRPAPADSPAPTLEGLREVWEAVLEAVGEQRRVVRAALTHAAPVAVADGTVILEVTESDVHLDGLQQSTRLIADVVQRITGWTVRVVCRPAGERGQPDGRSEPQRVDRAADQEERLQSWRTKDPALDTVAEALDLELLD
jgi:hypothetical protein